MMLTISSDEFKTLSAGARAELLTILQGTAALARPPSPSPDDTDPAFADFDMALATDLTPAQVKTWMEAASDKTKLGLRVIAEHGPVVDFNLLKEAGIDNIGQFQSRTTIRTRTITGNPDARLMTWDEWERGEDGNWLTGRYAVTPTTHQSLRRYFNLD